MFHGEKALFNAFLDKNISTSSKVCWQKTSSNGKIRIIDINDGKYIGSTTKFPSSELHIHFVRNEDEGTYRIVINTFRKIVHNSIQLKVKNRGSLRLIDRNSYICYEFSSISKAKKIK